MGGRRRVAGDGSVAGRGRVGGTVCHRGLVINSRAEENISLRVAGWTGGGRQLRPLTASDPLKLAIIQKRLTREITKKPQKSNFHQGSWRFVSMRGTQIRILEGYSKNF